MCGYVVGAVDLDCEEACTLSSGETFKEGVIFGDTVDGSRTQPQEGIVKKATF